jgi:hypothetical protein
MPDGDADGNSHIRFNPDETIEAHPQYVLIYNNLFTETRTPTDPGHYLRGMELSFSDKRPGYYCTGGDHIYVMNNIFYKLPWFGMGFFAHDELGLGDITDVRILNNVFIDMCKNGSNMLLFEKGDGTLTYGSNGDSASVIVDHNSVYASSGDYNTNVSYPGASGSYSSFKSTSGCQDSDVVSDPKLDANYKLGVDSPLRNAGLDLSSFFTTDYDGNTRSAWDIGAYEYGASGLSFRQAIRMRF